MEKQFQKNKEDFVCINCGEKIKGTGYTNHCPNCLFSLHVDINPGDRKNSCRGVMEPVKIEKKGKGYIIYHKCKKCNQIKKNKTSDIDNVDLILEILESQPVPDKRNDVYL
jgi:hypothetical protein